MIKILQVSLFAHVNVCLCMCMCLCVCTYMCMCACAYLCVRVCIFWLVYVCTGVYFLLVYVCEHVYSCVSMYVHVYIFVPVCMYTFTRVCKCVGICSINHRTNKPRSSIQSPIITEWHRKWHNKSIKLFLPIMKAQMLGCLMSLSALFGRRAGY